MKDKKDAWIGDAVEVECIIGRRGSIAPISNVIPDVGAETTWKAATLSYVDRHQVTVVFSDGERLALPFPSKRWRMA